MASGRAMDPRLPENIPPRPTTVRIWRLDKRPQFRVSVVWSDRERPSRVCWVEGPLQGPGVCNTRDVTGWYVAQRALAVTTRRSSPIFRESSELRRRIGPSTTGCVVSKLRSESWESQIPRRIAYWEGLEVNEQVPSFGVCHSPQDCANCRQVHQSHPKDLDVQVSEL